MTVFLMPYKIVACGLSHRGLIRQNNEDVWAELPQIRFFALADGMGGHQAGEVAARETVDILCRSIEEKHRIGVLPSTLSITRNEVRQIIELANHHVFKMGRAHSSLRGMGTTICCLYFHDHGVVYGHVGDSRIYRFRQGCLEQLTRDDSLLCDLVDQGQLSEQQAADFQYKNIITKAIGAESTIDPAVHYGDISAEDIYLMCSDGLSDLLTTDEIVAIINDMPSLEEGANQLIQAAIKKGGHDNITVVMMKVVREDNVSS
jgi:serine/threonine protein phosphatase PrpC